MPFDVNIHVGPVDYYAISGKTWKVTGLRVANNLSANNVFSASDTGKASGYYSSELGGHVATGVYASSGQFDNPNTKITWDLVHPKNNVFVEGNEAIRSPFFQSYEVNIRSLDGTLKTGIDFIDDGRISVVELISGGSGYINPSVYISGDGTGASVTVETFGTGEFSNLSGFSNVGESGYQTGVSSLRIVSGGSGYTSANTYLVVSGSGNDAYTIGQLATREQGGDQLSTSGSGAYLRVHSRGLGLRKGYYGPNSIEIPHRLNKSIFGGDGERKFVVEVIANDVYSNSATGRIIIDFPAPSFERVDVLSTTQGLTFAAAPATGEIFEGKAFQDHSLEKIEVHRGISGGFPIQTGAGSNTLFHTLNIPKTDDRLGYVEEITIPKTKFNQEDFFSGYYYKFIPYDGFGTGNLLEIGTGIRAEKVIDPMLVPSGFRTLVDHTKAVGTNIQGDIITNTYLSWKKDRKFNIDQYEVSVEDQVEQESYSAIVNIPQIGRAHV